MAEVRAALAIAEPFARRWLQAVRQKRSSRFGRIQLLSSTWDPRRLQNDPSWGASAPSARIPKAPLLRETVSGPRPGSIEPRPLRLTSAEVIATIPKAPSSSPFPEPARPRFRPGERGGNAAGIVAMGLPAWKASSAQASELLRAGAAGTINGRPKPRIPCLLFEDENIAPYAKEGIKAPLWLTTLGHANLDVDPGRPKGTAEPQSQGTPLPQAAQALARGDNFPDAFTVDARLSLSRVDTRVGPAQAIATVTRRAGVATLQERLVCTSVPSPGPAREESVVAEMADMEGAVRDFQVGHEFLPSL